MRRDWLLSWHTLSLSLSLSLSLWFYIYIYISLSLSLLFCLCLSLSQEQAFRSQVPPSVCLSLSLSLSPSLPFFSFLFLLAQNAPELGNFQHCDPKSLFPPVRHTEKSGTSKKRPILCPLFFAILPIFCCFFEIFRRKGGHFTRALPYIYIYIYMYACMYVCMYVYIYIWFTIWVTTLDSCLLESVSPISYGQALPFFSA